MKRLLPEIYMIGACLLAFMCVFAAGGGDDDKINDDKFLSSMLYLSDRLISEIIIYNGYGTVQEAATLWRNPVAGGSIFGDAIDAANLGIEMMIDPDFSDVYERGPYKGESKSMKLLRRNLWLTRIIDRINHIGANNRFYRIGNKGITQNVARVMIEDTVNDYENDDNTDVRNYYDE